MTLPELPLSLIKLDVTDNYLSVLPELPASLETLRSSYNQLAVLPGLPELLKSLDVDHNRLSALPKLPASLEKIDTCQNHLTELPELPISLSSFNVSFNLLARLPGLPESLEHINVHHNHPTTLPELPASLKKIDASVNHLERLPEFSAENNQGRRIFWFRHNQITHIPESITGLNEISLVDLESNPLSGRTLQSLQQLMSSPDYHGPQIHFSMSDGQQHTPVRTLTDAVAAWFPESLRSEVSQRWGAFTDEENTSTFSAFLDRLADTVTARNGQGFAQQVSEFLEKLSMSEALRQQCFAVAADATRSCEDRVALTWNNLQKTYRVHQASEGEFDSDLTGLLSLGREMNRLEVLE
ncbi:NEL-type E3 ubiquitin ligase domain-containing protein, partial [Escherichia fergusonii]|uniref:NEL-type E3 ubiquitin ligase domain-containing protein n=1 Tax=Escherichia fergusonii TaxID=564 RepID=UPI002FD21E72